MTIRDDLQRLYEENKRNPLAWVLVGVVILMLMGALWPLFIIAPGAVFLYAAKKGDKQNSGLIFPGMIITGTGLILLYQNMTGHWESWAYIWSLYPVMIGYAMRFNGQHTGNDTEITVGRNMMRYGLMAFAGLALFFELLIFGSLSAWLLLAAGVAFLWWRGQIKIGGEEKDEVYREKVRQFVQDKRKRVQLDVDELNEKRRNGEFTVNEDLRERINAVINEMRDVADDLVQRFDQKVSDVQTEDAETPQKKTARTNGRKVKIMTVSEDEPAEDEPKSSEE